MAQSKAFRAVLPQLRQHELANFQRWTSRSCALSTFFVGDRGSLILIALRNAPASSASHARSVRRGFQRLGIPTHGLRGHWLTCVSESEAVALCTSNSADLPAPDAVRPSHVEDDVKTIRLP